MIYTKVLQPSYTITSFLFHTNVGIFDCITNKTHNIIYGCLISGWSSARRKLVHNWKGIWKNPRNWSSFGTQGAGHFGINLLGYYECPSLIRTKVTDKQKKQRNKDMKKQIQLKHLCKRNINTLSWWILIILSNCSLFTWRQVDGLYTKALIF